MSNESRLKLCMRNKCLKLWASVICYAFSIALYLFDVVSDILLGKHLIEDEGIIVLSLIFLPVIATFSLVFFKRCCGTTYKRKAKHDPEYKLTLLGIDWLNLDDNSNYTTAVTVILITLRMHIIRVYILLIKAAITSNKALKKKLDYRMRAEMFMETCFESLPQCCVQLYLFGKYSSVSHLQVVSFTLSTLNLVYSFTLAHAEREVEIYHHTPSEQMEGIDVAPCCEEQESENDEEETSGLTKRSKRNGTVNVTRIDQSLILKILELGKPPPKKISMSLDLILHKETSKYDVTYAHIKSKQFSLRVEKAFFFWLRVINVFIESPVFFLTAFPTISLFSCMFGKKFLFLYAPVAIHFVAEYWWWRPNTYKFVMNGSFHTIFLAYKLLERIVILGMICIWFIKVTNYSKPMLPPHTDHLPGLVWPEQHPFLLAVSKYEKDGEPHDWGLECKMIKNPTEVVIVDKDQNKLIKVFNRFTKKGICAIDASTYILCVVYYMNLIGMGWEVTNYLLFWIFKWLTKHETWKELHQDQEPRPKSLFARIFETLCSHKYALANEFLLEHNEQGKIA